MNTYTYNPLEQSYGVFRSSLVTRTILIVTCAVSLLQWIIGGLFNVPLVPYMGLSFAGLRELFLWQPITYMLIHGSPLHLLMNMLGLFFMGPEVESAIGWRRYLGFYIVCGIFSGLAWLLISGGGHSLCIGASGSIFGLMGLFGGLFPCRRITLLLLYVIPVTMTARTMVIVISLIAIGFLIIGGGSIAHSAHLAGGLLGYFYGRVLARQSGHPPAQPRRSWFTLKKGPKLTILKPDRRDDSEDEVDRVLDKINRSGYASLTRNEIDLLERAAQRRNAKTP